MIDFGIPQLDEFISLFQDNSIFGMMLGIIILSYILEDLAIVAAAVIASQQALPAPLALLAIFIGISSGDLLLYGLGLLARRWRWLRYRLLTKPALRKVSQRLNQHTFGNIFVIRFIPGLRSISYTFCGFLKIKIQLFIVAVLSATALWTGLVFSLIYQVGSTQWLQDSMWKWAIAPLALIVLWLINRTSSKFVRTC